MIKKRKVIITALSILVFSCGLYTWGIPAVVNIESHKSDIEKLIFEKTKYKVDIGTPKLSMGMFPSVWLESDKVKLLNDDGSAAGTIDYPKIKIKLLPLLKKKIEVAKFSAQKEEIHLIFTKDSRFKIGQYLIEMPKKKGDFELSKMNLELGEYNIYLDDIKYNQKIKYSGKYFKNGRYIANKQARFATDSVLSVGGKESRIMADIDIDLPVNRLSEDKLKSSTLLQFLIMLRCLQKGKLHPLPV